MAGDTSFTRILLGMGLRRFSMNVNNLLSVKDTILRSDTTRFENQVSKLMRNEDPEKTDKLLKQLNADIEAL